MGASGQILTFVNVLTLAQPEAYIGGSDKLIDEKGVLSNEDTKKFIDDFLLAYADWVKKVS